MSYSITTLKRTTLVTTLVALFILLLAARDGFFHSDDFSHLATAKFETLNDPIMIITGAEFIGGGGHYRPMMKLFWGTLYLVFGLEPLGYFVTTIVIFLFNMLLLFIFARFVIKNALGAYSAILLFLLQGNVYLYTVNWIGAANNVLVGLFMIAALVFYVRSTAVTRRANFLYAVSLVCFVFALLSREIAIILIPVIVLYDFLFLWSNAPGKMTTIVKRLFYYAPFLVLVGCYVLMQSASGAKPLAEYDYSLRVILNRLVFFVLHLGFLPSAVLLLTVLSLVLDRPKLEERNLKLAVWGILFATFGICPFLFLGWTSPTWLYLPALGTSLTGAALFQQLWSNTPKRGALFLSTLLVWAIIGNLLLFSVLSNSRWWQWGRYTENVIETVTTQYPELPQGTTLFFIDNNKGEKYGIQGLFRTQYNLSNAFRIWYDDLSLSAYYVEQANSIEAILEKRGEQEPSQILVFDYCDGSIFSKTDWSQGLSE